MLLLVVVQRRRRRRRRGRRRRVPRLQPARDVAQRAAGRAHLDDLELHPSARRGNGGGRALRRRPAAAPSRRDRAAFIGGRGSRPLWLSPSPLSFSAFPLQIEAGGRAAFAFGGSVDRSRVLAGDWWGGSNEASEVGEERRRGKQGECGKKGRGRLFERSGGGGGLATAAWPGRPGPAALLDLHLL